MPTGFGVGLSESIISIGVFPIYILLYGTHSQGLLRHYLNLTMMSTLLIPKGG